MARPRINPEIRFSDVLDIWRYVEHRGHATYACKSEKEAIHKMHRLHMSRAALRGDKFEHVYDIYVIRREGTILNIVKKAPLDVSRFLEGGKEISPEEALHFIDGKNELSLEEQIKLGRIEAEKFLKKLAEEKVPEDQRDRLREIDPDKPLGLDVE